MSLFENVLATRPDPLDVLKTTAYVVEHARDVQIDHDEIARAADALAEKQIDPPVWNYDLHFHDGTPRTVNYLFLLDALNFCFWGNPKWNIEYVIASDREAGAMQFPTNLAIAAAHKTRLATTTRLDGYWALAASLKRAAQTNSDFLNADFLACITPHQLAEILRGDGEIPLFIDRWRNARELGTVLENRWAGQAARFVECAGRDAARLAQMIAENFASFNDISVYDNREVRFFKRAQILVADLWGAFAGTDWGAFANIDELTAFADYKLPQILRAWKILNYSSSLAEPVDSQIELAKDSPAEIEIRAAMLWAVEFLREALARRGRKLPSTKVDWILWEASQSLEGMKPYHRVRTIYY